MGIHLDEELTFKHINEKINRANNGIGMIRKQNNILPRSALLTIYSSIVRRDLKFGDVIYNQPENESVSRKSSIHRVSGHKRSYKRNLSRKALPGIRFGITQEQMMVEAQVLFLKLITAQKPLHLFNITPPKLNSLRYLNTSTYLLSTYAETIILKIHLYLMY